MGDLKGKITNQGNKSKALLQPNKSSSPVSEIIELALLHYTTHKNNENKYSMSDNKGGRIYF